MNMNFNQIIELLKSYGIEIELMNNAINNELFLFTLSLFVIAFISLLCVINIIVYLTILQLSEHKKVIEIVSKSKITLILFNLYKKTRKAFLVSELILLSIGVGSIVYICSIVLKAFVKVSFTFFS